jgi:hypothetical protein
VLSIVGGYTDVAFLGQENLCWIFEYWRIYEMVIHCHYGLPNRMGENRELSCFPPKIGWCSWNCLSSEVTHEFR